MKIYDILKNKEFKAKLQSLFMQYGLQVVLIDDQGIEDSFAISIVSKSLGDSTIPLYFSGDMLPIQEQIGHFKISISGKVREYEDKKIKIEPSRDGNLGTSILTIK